MLQSEVYQLLIKLNKFYCFLPYGFVNKKKKTQLEVHAEYKSVLQTCIVVTHRKITAKKIHPSTHKSLVGVFFFAHYFYTCNLKVHADMNQLSLVTPQLEFHKNIDYCMCVHLTDSELGFLLLRSNYEKIK